MLWALRVRTQINHDFMTLGYSQNTIFHRHAGSAFSSAKFGTFTVLKNFQTELKVTIF